MTRPHTGFLDMIRFDARRTFELLSYHAKNTVGLAHKKTKTFGAAISSVDDMPEDSMETSRDELFALVYDDLRRRAERFMRDEQTRHTLQPTALVHEAFLRMQQDREVFRDKRSFFYAAARAMRRILVDHARQRLAAKRGGGVASTPLEESMSWSEDRPAQVLNVHDALQRLEDVAPAHAKLVELRFFTGLPLVKVADVMGISESKVKRDWRFAKTWLKNELQ